MEVLVKITRKQLRKIIREEYARLVEKPDVPDVMGAMGGGKFQPRSGLDLDVDTEDKDSLSGLVTKIQNKFNVSEADALEAISMMMLHLRK